MNRANSSISAMRPAYYYLLEEIVILGVIYGSLVWRVCNPAAPAGVRGIPGLSPDEQGAIFWDTGSVPMCFMRRLRLLALMSNAHETQPRAARASCSIFTCKL